MLYNSYGTNWFSHFGRIPAALFNFDVRVRNVIHLGHNGQATIQRNYSSRLHRWFEVERPFLLESLDYSQYTPSIWQGRIPKVNTGRLMSALEKALAEPNRRLVKALSPRATQHVLHYKRTAYNWLNFCLEPPPCLIDGKHVDHTQFGQTYALSQSYRDLSLLLLDGKLALTYWFAIGDDFHVTRWNFEEIPCDITRLTEQDTATLAPIVTELLDAMEQATQFKLNAGRNVGNFNLAKCRHVTDKSDQILARAFGFSDVLDDVELYYIQTMRTTFDDGDE